MKRHLFSTLTLFLTIGILTACSGTEPKTLVSDLPALPTENVDLTLIPKNLAGSEPTPEGISRDALRFEDAGFDYMRKYLLDPTEELHNFVVKDGFSGCASGAHYYLESIPSEEVPFYMGTIIFRPCGVAQQNFLDFRISPNGQTLEISDVEKNNYVPYKTWFKTAKSLEFGS